MNNQLVLSQIKQLEKVIKSVDHLLGSDELADIKYYLETIKSEIKK
jgi:hypothetical protein